MSEPKEKQHLPRVWLAASLFPKESTGLEKDEWFFQANNSISLIKTNEHEIQVMEVEEHQAKISAIKAELEKAIKYLSEVVEVGSLRSQRAVHEINIVPAIAILDGVLKALE